MKTNPISSQILVREKKQQMHLSDNKLSDRHQIEKLETVHHNHQSESNDIPLVEKNCRVRWFETIAQRSKKRKEESGCFCPFS